MNRQWIVAAALAAIGSMAISCKKEDGPAPAGGGGGGASTGGGPVKIVYIPKNTGNPYFDPMIDGFRKAAEETGADFTTVAPATADATSQLPLIEAQVQRGVNVLALSPNSPDALNPALMNAMRKGVKVIAVDSDLTGHPEARTAAVLTVEPQTVGESQVELLGSLIGYKGEFAILSATTDAPNQNAWIAIMKQTLEKNPKYKEMKLVEVAYGNDEPQKSTTEAEALLTKYPNLKGIIAPTTVGIAAAAQVVKTANKAATVKVTGLGTPNQMRAFIKDGTVEAFALWSPFDEGYLAAQLGKQLAAGTLKGEVGDKFTAGTLGEREIKADKIVITGPPVTFTKDNIDQYKF